MKIIRDNQLGGIAMIPLLYDWRIRRCNQQGCTNIPNTIIANAGDGIPVFGLCEDHFQQGNKEGGTTLNLVWDNFDALVKVAPEEQDTKPVIRVEA